MIAASDALIVVFGASAITDRRDVIPAAIEAIGGRVEQFGMPVDPGNLLLLGALGGKPIIGAPGCARSPKENGFDWVLQRLLAGVPVRDADIRAMGVGGLLMEIVSRPQPRAGRPRARMRDERRRNDLGGRAGGSLRPGPKLLAALDGKPLVRHVAEAALASMARPVSPCAVIGGWRLRGALNGLDVIAVDNPAFHDGLSTSLKAGFAALPSAAEAAVVLLGDMPR